MIIQLVIPSGYGGKESYLDAEQSIRLSLEQKYDVVKYTRLDQMLELNNKVLVVESKDLQSKDAMTIERKRLVFLLLNSRRKKLINILLLTPNAKGYMDGLLETLTDIKIKNADAIYQFINEGQFVVEIKGKGH